MRKIYALLLALFCVVASAQAQRTVTGTVYDENYEGRTYRGEQEYEWPLPQSEIDCNSQLVQSALWS